MNLSIGEKSSLLFKIAFIFLAGEAILVSSSRTPKTKFKPIVRFALHIRLNEGSYAGQAASRLSALVSANARTVLVMAILQKCVLQEVAALLSEGQRLQE